MSIRNRLLTIAAASTLVAATAVPAMALENVFHGMLREKAILSNFDNYAPGTAAPPAKDGRTNFYVEQRARLLYEGKVSDDLKAVLQFEIDSRWGDAAYSADATANIRNTGGGLESDRVNLETKNVYLDFRIPGTATRATAGIQGFTDQYKGIYLGYADTAGLLTKTNVGPFAVTAGWLRFWDVGTNARTDGATAAGLETSVNNYILEGNFAVNKDLKVGLNYYLLTDGTGGAFPADSGATNVGNNLMQPSTGLTGYTNLTLHMVGATAEAKVGPATIDGFVVGQFGKFENATAAYVTGTKDVDVLSYAANLRAKMKVGPGTLRAEAIYVSGDGLNNDTYSGFITGSQYNLAGSFYVSPEMMILLPNKYDINSSKALAYDVNFLSQGVIGGFVGYDANLTDKVYANANAGFMAAAKLNSKSARAAAGLANDSQYLGTEINAEVGYKMYDNLTASLQGAYVLLGDYYKGTSTGGADPDNPYTARVMLNYTF